MQKELMLGALVGLARATEGNEDLITIETDRLALECLNAINVGIDTTIYDLEKLTARLDAEKRSFVPKCYSCASPCGRNNNYDVSKLEKEEWSDLKLEILKVLGNASDYVIKAMGRSSTSETKLSNSERSTLYRAIYAIGTEWTKEELGDVLMEVKALEVSFAENYRAYEEGKDTMIRKIIKIDESKCNGCGACAAACHEGAIEMIDGVAKLTREDYCDGLGDCLPACPTNAITFEEREAPAYDEAAVLAAKASKEAEGKPAGGCPGTMARSIPREEVASEMAVTPIAMSSKLTNWPVQIKLAPMSAPYFDGANLLIAADCTAFAYANFHNDFMRNKVTLIGCPKLDAVNYAEKLTEIIKRNEIKSVTIVRMEVPCCGGLENAVKNALQASGKFLPWSVVTISTDGRILD